MLLLLGSVIFFTAKSINGLKVLYSYDIYNICINVPVSAHSRYGP